MCLGVPREVVAVTRPGAAEVDVRGERHSIDTALVGELRVGDWVLVHMGFAMATIDATEARATLTLLDDFAASQDA